MIAIAWRSTRSPLSSWVLSERVFERIEDAERFATFTYGGPLFEYKICAIPVMVAKEKEQN